jgi:ABC-type transporter Mla MlaB component
VLRITQIVGQDSTPTFKLEGKLLEAWVAEVRNVCGSGEGGVAGKRLDLSRLSFVDQAGVKLLNDLIHEGFTVSASSGFVAELLQLETS